jgi:hypothetical protein
MSDFTYNDASAEIGNLLSSTSPASEGTTGGGAPGEMITVTLDQPVDGSNTIQAKAYTVCPPGRCAVIRAGKDLWYAFSGSAPKKKRSHLTQYRRTKSGEEDPEQKAPKYSILLVQKRIPQQLPPACPPTPDKPPPPGTFPPPPPVPAGGGLVTIRQKQIAGFPVFPVTIATFNIPNDADGYSIDLVASDPPFMATVNGVYQSVTRRYYALKITNLRAILNISWYHPDVFACAALTGKGFGTGESIGCYAGPGGFYFVTNTVYPGAEVFQYFMMTETVDIASTIEVIVTPVGTPPPPPGTPPPPPPDPDPDKDPTKTTRFFLVTDTHPDPFQIAETNAEDTFSGYMAITENSETLIYMDVGKDDSGIPCKSFSYRVDIDGNGTGALQDYTPGGGSELWQSYLNTVCSVNYRRTFTLKQTVPISNIAKDQLFQMSVDEKVFTEDTQATIEYFPLIDAPFVAGTPGSCQRGAVNSVDVDIPNFNISPDDAGNTHIIATSSFVP